MAAELIEHAHPEHEREVFERTIFGFWMYLMSDCVLFGTLFATYAVLQDSLAGGPSGKELFNLPYALLETLILLTSSFTSGLAMLSAHKKNLLRTILYFAITFILGASFLTLEINEFSHMVQEGNSWQRSAFLSSYFTLVSTHGLHITVGLLWMTVMMAQVLVRGFLPETLKRLTCLCLFWHFLDIVWIFIFTFVYLMGVT